MHALLAINLVLSLFAGGGGRADGIREVPVEFTVVNQNRSLVPCTADGETYTIRGHMVAPTRVARPRSVGLYVHGATLGEFNWRFKDVPGYDTMAELARLGHVSVAIDRLGFDSSGHPVGDQMCLGSEADVVSQIVDHLKAGTYRAGSRARGPVFSRVAVVGYSAGGAIAEIIGHSFGNADALGIVAWVDRPTPVHLRLAPHAVESCLTGGEPVEDDGTGPTGYAYSWPSWDDQHPDAFANTDPAVLAAVGNRLNRDPCGYPQSLSTAMTVNNLLLPLIDDPVLFVYADRDRIAPRPSVGAPEDRIGSSDVTVETIGEAGHTVMLQRTAPAFRSVLHAWLQAHGF
jgi:pimeloyl-ACP methyl ester carboxylesterase